MLFSVGSFAAVGGGWKRLEAVGSCGTDPPPRTCMTLLMGVAVGGSCGGEGGSWGGLQSSLHHGPNARNGHSASY